MRDPSARLAQVLSAAVLMVAALLFAPVAARAQPIQGLYVAGAGGFELPQNTSAALPAPGFGTGRLRLQRNGGFALLGSVGYATGGGWRFEVQGDFDRTGIDQLARSPVVTGASGHAETYGVMVNALYDLDIRNRYVFPYLGLGAGYLWERMQGVGFVAPGGATAYRTDAQDGRFAWQAMLGAAFPVPGMPGLSLTAEYRFRDITAGATFAGTGPGGVPGGTLKLGPQFDHQFLIGVRYAFDVAPPPAPVAAAEPVAPAAAAPAPAPARSFLVFFDWDKATLTARARQIVHQAAAASLHGTTRIAVNGYTDRSGTAQYNQALSVRRADAVAAELVRDGVPKAAISIHGFGQTHPLVPTGPGVREPQNRRVEIILG